MRTTDTVLFLVQSTNSRNKLTSLMWALMSLSTVFCNKLSFLMGMIKNLQLTLGVCLIKNRVWLESHYNMYTCIVFYVRTLHLHILCVTVFPTASKYRDIPRSKSHKPSQSKREWPSASKNSQGSPQTSRSPSRARGQTRPTTGKKSVGDRSRFISTAERVL